MRNLIKENSCQYFNVNKKSVVLIVKHIEILNEKKKNIFMHDVKNYAILRLIKIVDAGESLIALNIKIQKNIDIINNICNNDMIVGTYDQLKILDKIKSSRVDEIDAILKKPSINLYIDNGHRYGDGFLLKELNKNDIDNIFNLMDEIKNQKEII